MARIIGGSMIGELSGKLGGNVFARNKSGAYIRQYVIPVDPNTQAQADARVAFGTSSSSYHSLDSVLKNQWGNFAQNLYLPKNGINTGQYSGFNAFVALRNVVQNAGKLLISTPTVLVNGTPNTPEDLVGYAATGMPPSSSIQGNLLLATGGGTIQPFLTNTTVNTTGAFTFTLSLGSSTSPTPTNIAEQLSNGGSQLIGFAVFMSNPVQQSQMFIANPEIINLGYIPNIALETGTGTGVETIQVGGVALSPEKYQNWVTADNWVRITVYMTTLNGQMIRIGSQMAQVADA